MNTATTSYAAYQFYFNVFQFIFMCVVGAYTFWTNREKVTKSRFDAQGKRLAEIESKLGNISIGCQGHNTMTTRLDGHNDRLSQHKELIGQMQTELKHLPTQADITKLSDKIESLHGDVHEITGAMPGLKRAVDLMNEFLINNGRK